MQTTIETNKKDNVFLIFLWIIIIFFQRMEYKNSVFIVRNRE